MISSNKEQKSTIKNFYRTVLVLLFILLCILAICGCDIERTKPGYPKESLYPNEDHVIGFALIMDDDSQKELLSYTKDGICEYRTDNINSLYTLSEWFVSNENQYAIISDGSLYNPNMYILANGIDPGFEDYETEDIVCRREKTDEGTNKQIVFRTDKHGYIWLIYMKAEGGGSYYLKDTRIYFDGSDKYELDETYHAGCLDKQYSHHIGIEIIWQQRQQDRKTQ